MPGIAQSRSGVPILDRSTTAVNFTGPGTTVLTAANTYTGGTTIGAGSTVQIGNGTVDGSILGNVTNSGSLVFEPSDTVSYNGVISGAGTLTVNGAASSKLTLGGANTYTGGTLLKGGTLAVASDSGLGNAVGNLTFNGGTLQFTGPFSTSRLITLYRQRGNPGGGTIDTNSFTATLSGLISGSGPLTKQGIGTLTLTRFNTYTGNTTITGGTLQVGNGTAGGASIGNASNSAIIASGATLTLDLTSGTNFGNAITDGGHVINIGPANITISSTITGAGDLTQSGSGILTVTGANSYTGGTFLNGGELSLGSAQAIGATGSVGTISFAGGTLQYTSANTTDYSAQFSNVSGQTYKVDTNGQNVTFATALTSSNGTFTKLGAGTLKLTAANTYAGTTFDNAGTIDLANQLALQNSILNLNGGALWSLTPRLPIANTVGTSFTFGGLAGSGPLSLSNSASKPIQLKVGGNNTTSTYSGVLSGAGSLTKAGTGTLTLTSSNSYSGGTTVNAGTLAINGDTALGATSTWS